MNATSRVKKHYLTKDELLGEVIKSKEVGVVSRELAKMFMLIADRYSRKYSFANYSYREDMVAYALVNLCANGLKFDPERSNNPFAFYTTAIYRSFLQYLAEEKKHRSIRDTLILEQGMSPSNTTTNAEHERFMLEHGYSDDAQNDAPEAAPVIEKTVIDKKCDESDLDIDDSVLVVDENDDTVPAV